MSIVLAFGATVLLASPSLGATPANPIALADTSVAELFAIARSQLRRSNLTNGLATYLRAAAVAGTSEDWELFRRDLAWIATKAELATWDASTAGERSALVKLFWAGRDMRDGLTAGGRLAEHVRRLDLALADYQIQPKGGQPPIMRVSNTSSGSSFDATLGSGSPLRDFVPNQTALDDRAVILVRHGAPTVRTRSARRGIESWTYQRESGALTVHFMETPFDGSSGNTALVAAPPLDTHSALCEVDPLYCGTSGGSATSISVQRERIRQYALAAIKELTTTDSAMSHEG